MSPRTLLLGAALLAAPVASAQTAFGLKAGLNVSDLTGDDVGGSEPRLGFTGGAFVNVPFTPAFSVQPEVIYSQKGVSTEDDDATLEVDYVEVPVLLKYAVPVTETGLTLGAYAGPALGFKISEEVSSAFGGSADTDLFKSTDVGAALGVTVGAGPFAVDGRYTLGLSSAIDEDVND